MLLPYQLLIVLDFQLFRYFFRNEQQDLLVINAKMLSYFLQTPNIVCFVFEMFLKNTQRKQLSSFLKKCRLHNYHLPHLSKILQRQHQHHLLEISKCRCRVTFLKIVNIHQSVSLIRFRKFIDQIHRQFLNSIRYIRLQHPIIKVNIIGNSLQLFLDSFVNRKLLNYILWERRQVTVLRLLH